MGIINVIKYNLKKINLANQYYEDKFHIDAKDKFLKEIAKVPPRFEIINHLLSTFKRPTTYLEIGVRNPQDNFEKINSDKKYSVDPGYENAENNVDFKVTSDAFFSDLKTGKILDSNVKFDLIFIDGSHLAEQVIKDIANSLENLKEDGFIVMHDCNPPTEFHASETYDYFLSPAKTMWNGTTWKAFSKIRRSEEVFSCCIDTDWGVGIISKNINLGNKCSVENEFYAYDILDKNRKEILNLISFEELKKIIS